MFIIGEAVIEEQLAHEKFACNLTECKGACCTLPGGRGAPLEDDEVEELVKAYPFVSQYLPESRQDEITRHGMVEGTPGNYATACVDDNDCIFVIYEEGIARCAVERAYVEGRSQFRKPLSCHLFPIRISARGVSQLRYEQIPECHAARKQGRNLQIPLYDFLREALVRKFGEAWYDAFRHECERRDSPSPLL
ncbi:MAG TPA: DUF3109 family protein [Bacteroidota bacterium]|jgi:hypothetical protein|nr:DUF3109 family protein [Bacteroidota bacterium]